MVSELTAVLGGKSGVLAQWYQRHCLVLGLEAVRAGVASTNITASQSENVAARAVNALLPVVEKESHEDTRADGLGCLTRWALMMDAIPSDLLQFLKNGLRSASKPTAIASAGAACQLSTCVRTCVQLAPLLPDLLDRVELGAQKATVFHPDAIYGARAVLEVAKAETTWLNQVYEKFPWQALSDQTSFLFPPGILTPQFADVPLAGEAAGRLSPHVCTALCQVITLAAKLIAAASERVCSVPVSDASCSALVHCAVHANMDVRRAALDAMICVCDTVDSAQVMLIKAYSKVRRLCFLECFVMPAAAMPGTTSCPMTGKSYYSLRKLQITALLNTEHATKYKLGFLFASGPRTIEYSPPQCTRYGMTSPLLLVR